jgi:hypothetical protein
MYGICPSSAHRRSVAACTLRRAAAAVSDSQVSLGFVTFGMSLQDENTTQN